MAYRGPTIGKDGSIAPAKAWCDECGDDVPISRAFRKRPGLGQVLAPAGRCLCDACQHEALRIHLALKTQQTTTERNPS